MDSRSRIKYGTSLAGMTSSIKKKPVGGQRVACIAGRLPRLGLVSIYIFVSILY